MGRKQFFVSLLVLLGTFAFSGHLKAQTYVGGIVSTNTTWGLGDSPYIAFSDVTITNGAILTIEPGVEVRFDPLVSLDVSYGGLVARGTDTPTGGIKFIPNIGLEPWGTIRFGEYAYDAVTDINGNYISGSSLKHVFLGWGGATGESMTHVYRSSPQILSCGFIHSISGGVWIEESTNFTGTANIVRDNVSDYPGGGC